MVNALVSDGRLGVLEVADLQTHGCSTQWISRCLGMAFCGLGREMEERMKALFFGDVRLGTEAVADVHEKREIWRLLPAWRGTLIGLAEVSTGCVGRANALAVGWAARHRQDSSQRPGLDQRGAK